MPPRRLLESDAASESWEAPDDVASLAEAEDEESDPLAEFIPLLESAELPCAYAPVALSASATTMANLFINYLQSCGAAVCRVVSGAERGMSGRRTQPSAPRRERAGRQT